MEYARIKPRSNNGLHGKERSQFPELLDDARDFRNKRCVLTTHVSPAIGKSYDKRPDGQ